MYLTPVRGGNAIYIKVFVVPKISRVQNEHLELASGNYLYLANIWLCDVWRHKGQLEIHVLIGADCCGVFKLSTSPRKVQGNP